MNIILAKTAGFCFGVRRAVDTVYDQIDSHSEEQKIYTYGPVIHNMEVVKDLEAKGVTAIEGEDQLAGIRGQILIVRAHGVSRHICEQAEEQGITLVDATCPFVKKIHEIVDTESQQGRRIIIVGDSSHPEVQGIMGWVHGDPIVIKSEAEAQNVSLGEEEEGVIVAQTTFHSKKFNNIVEIIEKKRYHIRVINTICSATRLRQEEAESVSKQADIMFVIGDRRSSNTQKLFDICKTYCTDTYYIQTVKDLEELTVGWSVPDNNHSGKLSQHSQRSNPSDSDNPDLHNLNLQPGINVGITAGASTPNNIIQEVFLTCQKKKISTR